MKAIFVSCLIIVMAGLNGVFSEEKDTKAAASPVPPQSAPVAAPSGPAKAPVKSKPAKPAPKTPANNNAPTLKPFKPTKG